MLEPLGSAVVEEGTDTKFNYKEYLAASQVIQVKQEPDYSQTPISLVFNLRSRELNVTLTEAKRYHPFSKNAKEVAYSFFLPPFSCGC